MKGHSSNGLPIRWAYDSIPPQIHKDSQAFVLQSCPNGTLLTARAKSNLKRFHKFRGKHARLFSEVLRADPIVSHDGLVRLAEEPSYFFGQVFLRRAERLAIRKLQILLRGCNIRGG